MQSLARSLSGEFGPGFGRRNLFNMVKFAECFPDRQIVQTLSAQLGWSHFTLLLRVDDPLARTFYAEMGRIERWSVRTLQAKIDSRLFLRTAIAAKPAEQATCELAAARDQRVVTPDMVFRDPYVLDFLGLRDTYSERDLETAILREIEAFLLELGGGFAFVARQVRMSVDGIDHYLDLLFFHRHLRRLVAVDLKLGEFKPADKGQMELYLAWLRETEQAPAEEPPLGLILCAGKNEEAIRLLGLHSGDVRVASYIDRVLPQQQLEERLRAAVRLARTRFPAGAMQRADGDLP
jgi:predicted nuclease of restriction endonuclease-like (RecB) superfamily